jgi:short-subunit dehydrogenase
VSTTVAVPDRPLTHVLVTGASSGLGLELARLFAADGHALVLVARSAERLTALADTLGRDYEVDVRAVACDLAAPGAVSGLVARLDEEGVGIRHLVNNAGVGAYGPFAQRDWETTRVLVDLNVSALTELTHRLLPPMLAADAAGHRGVMNVASTAAFQPGPLMAVYFASKSYVLSFSESLAEELRGSGVTVSAFCPGPTRTEFFSREAMIPPGTVAADGTVDPAALARYERREARRMSAATAARVGYHGYLAGRVVVIPGWRNALMAQLPRLAPRALVRRAVHAMMRK